MDFDLDIGVGSGTDYPLAARCPAGEARETMHFPYDHDRMSGRLKDLTTALAQSPSIARNVLPPELFSVQEMGRDFFNALFTGEIRPLYDVSHRMALEQDKGLRVRLRIQSGDMSTLPWEYLFDPRSGEYLGLSSSTPLVRYLEVPQAVRPIAVDLPLRVLGMVCSPSNLPTLNVTQEKKRVDEALAELQNRGLVKLTWLPGQTWSDLQDALLEGPWHIFHYIGHGDFDKTRDEGFLALAGEDGRAHRLYATELARLLADHRELRVVMLNACRGAQSSWQSIYSSVAAVLVRRGIACTIANQFPITDNAAVHLSRRFYSMIARGLPVDTALTEARKSLSIAYSNSVEWGTPVLFMRSPDGQLFQMEARALKEKVEDRPAPIPAPQRVIHTQGGAYIQGNIHTGGGDFVGRDQVKITGPRIEPIQPKDSSAERSGDAPMQSSPSARPAWPEPARGAERQSENPYRFSPMKPFEPELVFIPASEFWMGSPDEDQYARDDEKPYHRVWLDDYWIGRSPVTVTQFSIFVSQAAYRTTAEEQANDYTWRTPRGKGSSLLGKDQYPVQCLSWEDAQAYCRWLADLTGRPYDLPTEAQWEKAARGSDGRIYAWGNAAPTRKLCNINNWFDGTTPIEKFSPAGDSFYHCSDMTGNVCQWCRDWYDSQSYAVSPAQNPPGPESGNSRVLRGGAISYTPENARCAHRLSFNPNRWLLDSGLRVVMMT